MPRSTRKITGETFIVVSTQGQGDEEALEKAAGTNADHLAFVASNVKAKKVFDYLREVGVSSERASRIRAPAGLDIRATSPEASLPRLFSKGALDGSQLRKLIKVHCQF
jgi:xanthine/CO dehydrogenase XdhC/CoxF family maturation factor